MSDPESKRSDDFDLRTDAGCDVSSVSYIAYPTAARHLQDRLAATPEEIAAWVFLGPDYGGLAAYTNANELKPPPRFFYDPSMGDDYVSPLMRCWFNEEHIAQIDPPERFITGAALIERWSGLCGGSAAAYVLAKVAESRLQDLHPVCGLTKASVPEDVLAPPLESGLFSVTQIEAIEAEDFLNPTTEGSSQASSRQAALKVGSPEWRSENARKAALARHRNSSHIREAKKQLLEAWASGKYDSRDRCAEEEGRALGLSISTARKTLRGTPDPSRT